jgi:predicted HAD superfamily phosphohydrolase YqeG
VTGGRPGLVRCRTIALDFGSTISTDREDPAIGQKGADPQAAAAVRELDRPGIRLLLATNATTSQTRWPPLQMAGVHELFAVALISSSLKVRKDDPLFYDLVITAVRCPARQVLFAGDSIADDVAGPMRARMQACLVRPAGVRPGEQVPGPGAADQACPGPARAGRGGMSPADDMPAVMTPPAAAMPRRWSLIRWRDEGPA